MPGCNLWLHRRAIAKSAGPLLGAVAIALVADPVAASTAGFVGRDAIGQRAGVSAAGTARAFEVRATASGTIKRLSAYLGRKNTASEVRLGLYADASSRPGSRIAACTLAAPRPRSWNSCDVSAARVTNRARYWTAILQPAGSTGKLRFRRGARGSSASYGSARESLSVLPASFDEGARASASPVSIFADAAPSPSSDSVLSAPQTQTRVKPPRPKPHPKPTPTPEPPPPTPTPEPPPPPPPTSGSAPTLTPVDGGPGYYAKFAVPLPSSPDYFPTAVWGSYDHTQANLDLDAAAGINTYVWVADPCNGVPRIRADGRFEVIYDQSENRSCAGLETSGWQLGDEVDMCCGPPGFAGGNGYTMLTSWHNSLPADGKMRYTNYGKGVLWWENDADAARFVNLPFLGLVSADAYWMTDPNERGNPKYGMPSSYGWNVDRLRFLDGMDGQRKPIWMLVETAWPFNESASQGGRAILPAEMRAAAWHSIIAGARGIVWFEHSFGGPTIDHHTLRTNSAGTRPMATSVDAQIKSLAPVLNSPSVTSGTSTGAGIRALYKWDGRNFYVIAGSTITGNVVASMGLLCVGSATATVLGESGGTRPVTNGTFTDSFPDKNSVHIYRIDGGSRCGL